MSSGKERMGGLSRSRRCCLGSGDFRQEKAVREKMGNLLPSRCDEEKGSEEGRQPCLPSLGPSPPALEVRCLRRQGRLQGSPGGTGPGTDRKEIPFPGF